MNGKQQTEACARLDHLAGFRVGDLVDVPTLGRCEVIGLDHPSLLRLRTSTGATLKAGVLVCQRVRKIAKVIQTRAADSGYICVLRSPEERAHPIDGHNFELVGVYAEGCREPEILNDLTEAGVKR